MNNILIKNAILIKFYSDNKYCNIDIIRNYIFHYIMNGKYLDRREKFKLKLFFVKNKNINIYIQRSLSIDSLRTIRRRLARNAFIDISIQKILANDCESEVRLNLAQNPNIDLSIQKILANDHDHGVRNALFWYNPTVFKNEENWYELKSNSWKVQS